LNRRGNRPRKCPRCGLEGPERLFDKAYQAEGLDLIARYSDEEGSTQDLVTADGDELFAHIERLRRRSKNGE
jgi:hypothetical protein